MPYISWRYIHTYLPDLSAYALAAFCRSVEAIHPHIPPSVNMAPPPPPSVNLLRALRALTAVRSVVPIQTRRSLYSKPSTTRTTASTCQHLFHRKLHLPQAIPKYHRNGAHSHDRLQVPPATPPTHRSEAALPPSSIIPSPHLLARRFHASPSKSAPSPPPPSGLANASSAPSTLDRGPISDEDTQTNFNTMDILSSTPAPASSIDACLPSGFHLSNGV